MRKGEEADIALSAALAELNIDPERSESSLAHLGITQEDIHEGMISVTVLERARNALGQERYEKQSS
jgi:uncharacterized protein Smg (DUF494 family)